MFNLLNLIYCFLSGVKCDDLKSPVNGRIINPKMKKKYEFEDKVNFDCEKGYLLIGKKTLICQHNEKWSEKEPVCKSMINS